MISVDELKNIHKKNLLAFKKLSWHEEWRDDSPKIPVTITGLRREREYLKLYFSYINDKGKEVHGVDTNNQFKL